ncbi:MAG: hypothetical protein AAF170_10260 [Bacteroidota bacterium]
MDLDLAFPPALLAICGVMATGLAIWSYGRSTPPVSGWRRVLLTALRATAFWLVLLLLFDPVWKRLTRSGEPPLLAVLIDSSESLTLGTTGITPSERVRSALTGLPDDAALRFYTFDGDAAPRGTALPDDSLQFVGERTDIAAALGRVEADFAGRNLRGVVLVSDGRSTDGRNPAYLAERFPVPVYTAVAGDSLSSRDVRLARVATNEVAYAGSPLPIRAGVRAIGYPGQRATVTVSENGRTLDRQEVTLQAGSEVSADLDVTPSAAGLRRYTISVIPLDGEATTRNNTRTVSVRVLDDSRRLLLLAAAPSPDLTALRAVLEADRSLDVTVRTQRSPGRFYEGDLPATLGQFDLVVLAGYPGTAADASTVQRVATAIQDGLPAVFVLTRQTDLRRLAETLGDLLPASPSQIRPGFVSVSLAPTPAGAEHPVLRDVGVAPGRFRALPPLAASPTRWALRPGTRVLGTIQRGGTVLESPLLAVRQSGTVRTAALLGTGSWRWRTLPDDLADLQPAYPGLIDRLVRWTTAARDRRPVRVRADRALFGERERVTFIGQVYGEDFVPVEDAAITLTLRGSGGTTSLSMRPVGNGRYLADAGVRPAGSYTFTAEATRGGGSLGQDRGTFGVGALAVEFREPGADIGLMRQIALRSGGAPVPLDSLGAFVRGLRSSGQLADRSFVREDATLLLTLPWLLALAVVLLATEWVARKRFGMV